MAKYIKYPEEVRQEGVERVLRLYKGGKKMEKYCSICGYWHDWNWLCLSAEDIRAVEKVELWELDEEREKEAQAK